MKILLKAGRIIDPSQGLDEKLDLLIENGRVKALGKNIPEKAEKVIDCQGLIVCPGLIDMHVHLREPGEEWKETIASGTLAGAAGGFTSVACMPNTIPPNDNEEVTRFILKKASQEGLIRVYPIACITKEQKGEELTEFGRLKASGAVALSDDGKPIIKAAVMRIALEYAKSFGLLIISHAEDLSLSEGGHINEGRVSASLGIKGIPWAAESIAVAREIMLAELTKAPIHIAHVSTKASVELIREAKKKGLPVTAETAPHYFTLTEEETLGYNTLAKVNPPLRSQEDQKAIIEGIKDGTIDVIATDHAPHSPMEKDIEFEKAAFGLIGLETALPLTLRLVQEGIISLSRAIELLSTNPARILQIPGGTLQPQSPADITIIDPHKKWVVTPDSLHSKSKNSPFLGWEMKGQALYTIVQGKVVFSRKK